MQHVREVSVEVTRAALGGLSRRTGIRKWSYANTLSRPYKRSTASTSQSGSVQRLSQFWIPTSGFDVSSEDQDDTHSRLIRAGYLRQAHSGIFHMLPLGNRVQQKLERLIDKHMGSLGASKVSLSSITTEDLWQRSGRLEGHGSELFKLSDRKDAKLLLSPTHEEEITSLVAASVKSYRDLPLRLYQISRKYRDEQRPRQGLLRGREFLMKDLYTFDSTVDQAIETYEQVRSAYRSFLDELKVPYAVARADSGSMGGNLSHEYHFISPKGEDHVISCNSCDRTVNEELVILEYDKAASGERVEQPVQNWFGISKDRQILVQAVFPKYSLTQDTPTKRTRIENEISIPAVKAALKDVELDTSIAEPLHLWKRGPDSMKISLLDARLPPGKYKQYPYLVDTVVENTRARLAGKDILLTRTYPGDTCPACKTGQVQIDQAIEIGHTFHLGTRYSKPLNASVVGADNRQTPLEMGCHGIGVSRLIGAMAGLLADNKGLNWPAKIAPFNIAILPAKMNEADAVGLYEALLSAPDSAEFDPVLDDRDKTLGWKLKDADLVGYPVMVVVGNGWTEKKEVDVQCRRLGVKLNVGVDQLAVTIKGLLEQL